MRRAAGTLGNGRVGEHERTGANDAAGTAVAPHAAPSDDGALGAEDAAQRDTAALWARLWRLHRDLADCYRDLLGETGSDVFSDSAEVLGSVEKRVAAGGTQSDITSVQPAATNARKMLSATSLADLLDVDPKTVRRWRDEGKLPSAVVIGGVVRWRPEDVDAWLAEARS